jgi:hypothetical protein
MAVQTTKIPIPDACVRYDMSYNQVWRLVLLGAGHKVGTRWVVDVATLERALREREQAIGAA